MKAEGREYILEGQEKFPKAGNYFLKVENKFPIVVNKSLNVGNKFLKNENKFPNFGNKSVIHFYTISHKFINLFPILMDIIPGVEYFRFLGI